MKTWEIIWVAVGIVLTTASQLRLASFPFGPGEATLSIWMLLVGIEIGSLRQVFITPITRVIFWFWTVSFTCLALGFLIAESMALTSEDIYHDLLAFMFAFSFSITFLIRVSSNKELKKLLKFFLAFTIVSLFIIFLFPGLIPFLTPWYGDTRFAAWSNDPNQLALLLSPIPFFCLYFFSLSRNKLEKIWHILLMLLAFLLGVETQSDSLKLWWTIASVGTIFLIFYREVTKRTTSYFSSYKNFVIKQLILSSLLLITLFLGYVVYEQVYAILSNTYNYGAQGSDRLTLWKNALAGLSHSPLFGLGPGAHSGYTKPFLNTEAHNTFIDWAASYGIVGLACYLTLLGWISWKAWKNGSSALIAALISLIGYSVFVYTARHIVFWFSLLAITNLSTPFLTSKSTDNQKKILSDL
jgi:O-antigen ligase